MDSQLDFRVHSKLMSCVVQTQSITEKSFQVFNGDCNLLWCGFPIEFDFYYVVSPENQVSIQHTFAPMELVSVVSIPDRGIYWFIVVSEHKVIVDFILPRVQHRPLNEDIRYSVLESSNVS